ncbi:MAG: hypothetical protein MZU97_01860 [Bacillus subtilis]|nr:hypothetical protein [Bacillus subtilis]
MSSEIEEKQNSIYSKVASIEDISAEIANILKAQTSNKNQDKKVIEKINLLKDEISVLNQDFEEIHKFIRNADKTINNVSENNEKIVNIIGNIDNSEQIKDLKTATQALDINLNTVISGVNFLDEKNKSH